MRILQEFFEWVGAMILIATAMLVLFTLGAALIVFGLPVLLAWEAGKWLMKKDPL